MTTSSQRYDVHSCFARSHLRTREERAIYFTLVAQLASSWSAAELARAKHLDTGTAAAVLERYAEADVVEAIDAPSGRRYRWRSDMGYLYGPGPNLTNHVDPVCGMRVDEQTPHRVRDARGRMRLFCSDVCASLFHDAQSRSCRPDGNDMPPARGSEREGAVLTLLYVEHCPGFPLVAERLRAALAQSYVDGLLVRARPIRKADPPIPEFAGSPTLLINGVDPFPSQAPSTGVGCRFYRTGAGLEAAPSVDQLVTALRALLAG